MSSSVLRSPLLTPQDASSIPASSVPFLTTSAPGLTSVNFSSSCPEDREASLRRTIKTLEKELSKKDKQLREFCDAATDLHHNMEEQEGALTNQLLRHQETIRMQHSHGLHHVPLRREHVPPIHPTHPPSVRNVSISPTRTTSPSLPQHHHNHQHQQHPSHAQTHLLGHGGVPYVNSNTGSRSVSPGLTSDYLTDANGTKDWKAMYLEAEKRCQMLQHAIEKMQSEVYLHRTRARKMLESVTKPKEVIALAEIRAENIVDRKLHSMSRYRSGSISSTSSMSECESTTPRERGDGMTAALRAHTRTLLTSSVPLMNSPSTGSVCTSTSTTMNGNPCETGTLCGSLCSAMVSGNANSVQPLFNTMREEMSEELRDPM